MDTNKSQRNIGVMAQSKLEEWAAQVSITANRSTQDQEGWDYILQFPFSEIDIGIPVDLRQSRIECLVQVKGIETDKKNKQIMLSNWEKLVKTPLPTFFLIIQYGTENDPKNAYLVEVNEKWTTKLLERLRKLPEEQKHKLNKLSMYLTWSDSDRLDSLDGEGLKSKIEELIGENYSAYIQKKQKIIKEVGQGAPFIVHFQSMPFQNTAEMITEWVDYAIGLKDKLRVSKLTIEKDIRFGIPKEIIEEGETTIFLDVSKSGKPIKMIFIDEKNNRKSTFSAVLFTPDHFFPNEPVPDTYRKIRIKSELGEIIFNPFASIQETNINLHIKYANKPQEISELFNYWQIVLILQNSHSNDCFIELRDGENEPFRMKTSGQAQFPKDFLITAKIVEDFWYLVKILDNPPETKILLDQLLSQGRNILEIRQLHDPNILVELIMGKIAERESHTQYEQAVIFSRALKINENTLLLLFAFSGQAIFRKTPDGVEFKINNPRMIHFSHDTVNEITSELINKKEIDLADRLEHRNFEVIIFKD